MPKISVKRLVVGELAVNCYLVENTETRECFIVDPGADAKRIMDAAGDCKVCAVLLTHGHYDHIGALDEICAHYQIPAYIHSGDAAKLADPMGNVSAVFGEPVSQSTVPVAIEEGKLTLAGIEVRIIDQDEEGVGEIIVKGPSVMIGYYEDPEATAEVLKDGWLHTGDYGRFDEEGFLYICGRKKNVIVTKNGKNIFPEEIEAILAEQPFIEEVLVYGTIDKRDGDVIVRAEVYPNYDALKEQLGEITEDGVKDAIKISIEEVNDMMPAYKRVKRFKIREEEFEKTTARKIKRMGGAIREEEDE